MDCKWFEANISRYFEQEMDAQQRAAFEQHTHCCARCARLYRDFPQVISALHTLPEVYPPQSLSIQFLNEQKRNNRRKRLQTRLISGIAAAMIVLVGGYVVFQNIEKPLNNDPGESPTQTQIAMNTDKQPSSSAQEGLTITGTEEHAYDSGAIVDPGFQQDPNVPPEQTDSIMMSKDLDEAESPTPDPEESQEPETTPDVPGTLSMEEPQTTLPLQVADVTAASDDICVYLDESGIAYLKQEIAEGLCITLTLTSSEAADMQAYLETLGTLPADAVVWSDTPVTLLLTTAAL